MKTAPRTLGYLAVLLLACGLTGVVHAQAIEIRGQLLTGRAQPLAGAEVVLLPHAVFISTDPAQGPAPVARTLTGNDGRFRLLAPGQGFWEVAAPAPDRLELRWVLAPLLAAIELPRVTLPAGQPVALRVHDADDRPVAGALVVVGGSGDPAGSWHPPLRFATTDADGLALVARRSYEGLAAVAITPTHLGWSTLAARAQSLDVVLDHELRAARLLREDGLPIADARIVLDRPRVVLATSDEHGALTLPIATTPDATTETHTALPLHLDRGLMSEPMPAAEPSGDADVPLALRAPPTFPVLLGVLDVDLGEPITGVWVWQPELGRPVGRGGPPGLVLLEAPAGAPIKIEVGATGYLAREVTLPAQPHAKAELVAVALSGVVELDGRALDTEGRPVAGA